MTSHSKALRKASKTGEFFDSLDKKLGNGRYLSAKPKVAYLPRKK